MFDAAIETEVGDRLNLLRTDGHIGGKAILSFITGLSAYCLKEREQTDVEHWFSNLQTYTNQPICELSHLLRNCFYHGELDSEEDAYRWILERVPEILSEERLEKDILELMEKWVNAKPLLSSVNEITRLLNKAKPEPTWWYEPLWTVADFESLSQTLLLAIQRKAERVRIKFT